jgi:hypothetical protein
LALAREIVERTIVVVPAVASDDEALRPSLEEVKP